MRTENKKILDSTLRFRPGCKQSKVVPVVRQTSGFELREDGRAFLQKKAYM
jgi:hypothetical protein